MGATKNHAMAHALSRSCTSCGMPFLTTALEDATLCPGCLEAGDREPVCEECGQQSPDPLCIHCRREQWGQGDDDS